MRLAPVVTIGFAFACAYPIPEREAVTLAPVAIDPALCMEPPDAQGACVLRDQGVSPRHRPQH
jgi:hypothetical protein